MRFPAKNRTGNATVRRPWQPRHRLGQATWALDLAIGRNPDRHLQPAPPRRIQHQQGVGARSKKCRDYTIRQSFTAPESIIEKCHAPRGTL